MQTFSCHFDDETVFRDHIFEPLTKMCPYSTRMMNISLYIHHMYQAYNKLSIPDTTSKLYRGIGGAFIAQGKPLYNSQINPIKGKRVFDKATKAEIETTTSNMILFDFRVVIVCFYSEIILLVIMNKHGCI